jgi:hypothetical protein
MSESNITALRLGCETTREASALLPHYHTHRRTPQAHLHVIHAIDRAVFPLRGRGGEGGRVVVAGGGVEGEDYEPLAVGAVHLDFELVEEFPVALPFPAEVHVRAADRRGEDGLERREVGRGFLGADEAEVDADLIQVGVRFADFAEQIEDAVQGADGNYSAMPPFAGAQD